jgi:peptidoglycan/xylan/chitin deacetylase (PgdA/CDA1 family)
VTALLQPIGRLARLAAGVMDSTSGRRLSILIFHRVLPEPDPILPGEIWAERFDRLMGLVAGCFQVLPLGEACTLLQQGRLPGRALAITFDDGYADNHDIALPILRRHGLPACFFVATGFLDGGRMFNDTVIEAVRHSPLDSVDLPALGLGRLPLAGASQRAAAIGRILPVVKYLRPAEREPALAALCDALAPRHLREDLMMRSDQVRALHDAGMEVGAHTVHHPILSTLDDAHAEREITEGRDRLEAIIRAPVRLLAYPNGRPDRDYDRRHAAMARRLGFDAAVTTAPGCAGPDADPFQLPRFTPWDAGDAAWLARVLLARHERRFAVAAAPALSSLS